MENVTCIVCHNCITEMYKFISVKNFSFNMCMFKDVLMTNEEGFGLSVIGKEISDSATVT
jgi:hypothetical protein